MSKPYASVVIPTHDRATTLGYTVRSALHQSIADVEVLIAGDGCTPVVRQVAEALVREDRRVRFLDLPKTPYRGAANRDHAVRAARADRIFYSDDDDLLLPHHVEVLGAALDRADIVDTPVASVDLEGGIHLGLLNSGSPLQRQLLAEGRLKGVFDTHLAHRKSAYVDRPAAWLAATDHRVVLHMLRGFAADQQLRWETLQRVTALSFHGAARVAMPPDARAAELASWAERVAGRGIEAWACSAGGRCVHGLAAATALRDRADSLDGLLRLLGLQDAVPRGDGERQWRHPVRSARAWLRRRPWTGVRNCGSGREPWQALAALVDLLHGRPSDEAAARDALGQSLQPVLGPTFPAEWVIRTFVRGLGEEEVERLCDRLPDTCAALSGRLHLAALRARADDVRRLAPAVLQAARPGQEFFAGLSAVAALLRCGMSGDAMALSRRLAPSAPESRLAVPFWERARAAAEALGDAPWARHAVAQAERLGSLDR